MSNRRWPASLKRKIAILGRSDKRVRVRRLVKAGLASSLAAGMVLGTPGMAQAVDPNADDLNFILKQFDLSTAHPNGNLRDGDPNTIDIIDPQLPDGLRTATGIYNNLLPGQEQFGAADNLFPRLLEPLWRLDDNGTSYGVTGDIRDSDPRMISNLIVDMTDDNPAAAAAAADTPGSSTVAGTNLNVIPNRAPDEGLSAPYNAWFTAFGQFFDHGLDLVTKGNAGTIMMPLPSDDPLIAGEDGILEDDPNTQVDETADNLRPEQQFMPLTRASVTVLPGPDGQTGTADDRREHTNTTSPFVDQNQTYTSHPSHQVFLREYVMLADRPVSTGRLLDNPARGGLATWADIKQQAADLLGIALTDADVLNVPVLETDAYGKFTRGANGYPQFVMNNGQLVEAAPAVNGGPVPVPADAKRTGHAFLDDIAHFAVPKATADADTTAGGPPPASGTYDNELLEAHFITGDGRGNENIGLTAVHHVFHAEHNLLVDEIKGLILAEGPAFAANWQLTNGDWDGEKLFQAAKFMTEMEYQHLVFEEFARKVQPQVDVFGAYQTDIDPAITAEFAHTVYRFGHSMLREEIPRIDAAGNDISTGLIEGFLNPLAFNRGHNGEVLSSREAAGAVARGMTAQVGNEIDEFVTDGVRSNLLGLPLDLAAINIARARDTGVPSLNEARRQFYAATTHPALKPYESWRDFKFGIRNPESLTNFVAAYGTHPDIAAATTVAAKRAAAQAIVDGTVADGSDFINGTGAWAAQETGLEDVDFWVGGLAEKQMPFGGLLGSTFNFVFETQMEKLQDGDRLYYLTRTAGLNFLTQLEQNSFSELVSRTTGAEHLPFDVFSVPDMKFELANLGTSGPILDDPATPYDESNLPEPDELVRMNDGTVRYVGAAHVLMGGTGNADRMRTGDGDDTVWGDGGDDHIEGDAGNDSLNGDAGDDIITDIFGDDNIKGGDGDDAINAGGGIDLILGGGGKDFVVAGSDPKETFGGGGDDFVIAGEAADVVFGNQGHDWIEGGSQADGLNGEHAEPFFDDTIASHDVMDGQGGPDELHAEGGDDVLVQGPGQDFNEGMVGYDWAAYVGDSQDVDADLNNTGLVQPERENLFDFFDLTEALSGGNMNDILRGSNPVTQRANDRLTQESLTVINGLAEAISSAPKTAGGEVDLAGINNIMFGGDGTDVIEGRGGNDVIDGDRWLNVQLEAPNPATPDRTDTQLVGSMTELQADVFAGRIDPGDIEIVRSIETAAQDTDVDVALFSGDQAAYTVARNGDRSVTVTGPDGVDTLRNIEKLQFADGELILSTVVGDNSAPTGVITLSGTPAENETLTATSNVEDADGVSVDGITYTWQVGSGANRWMPAGEGLSLLLTDAHVGKQVRLVATYVDGDGVPEIVHSEPTALVANVDDAATGSPVVQPDPAQVRTELTSDVTSVEDEDGLTTVSYKYQWQQQDVSGQWQDVAGATAANFTPSDAFGGKQVRVVVTFTDDRGSAEQLESSAVQVDAIVPDAPTIGAVTAGVNSATVNWTAPAGNGGSAVTGYLVKVVDATGTTVGDLRTAGEGATSLVVDGLQNGESYTFQVAAVNAKGQSAFSAASEAATPGALPAAPTGVTVERGNGAVTVRWSPWTDNGAPVTGYKVRVLQVLADQSTVETETVDVTDPSAVHVVIDGLTNGTPYKFEVWAVNRIGAGESFVAGPVVPATYASEPRDVKAYPGVGSARVSWTAPADNGGSEVTGYKVTVLDRSGGQVGDVRSTADTTLTVDGLTNGRKYRFVVTAVNGVGEGAASVASNAIVPKDDKDEPDAPAYVEAQPGVRSVRLSWPVPDDGGSEITGYRVQVLDASGNRVGDRLEAHTNRKRVRGLDNGGSYAFEVWAVNDEGWGTRVRSDLVTLADRPGGPRIRSPRIGHRGGQLTVTPRWRAPGDDGGSAVAGYRVLALRVTGKLHRRVQERTWSPMVDDRRRSLRMVLPAGVYRFKVAAVNAVGAQRSRLTRAVRAR
jgi:Ca2+-binding RTX toxin-like protein